MTEVKEEYTSKYVLNYIPYTWRNIVCTCPYQSAWFSIAKKHTRCGKYTRWTFRHKCGSCGEPYVKDFKHPSENQTTCYGCLVRVYGSAGAENYVTQKPREPLDFDAEGVFDIPDGPTFNF